MNGQRVVNASGYYTANADQVIGVAQPLWTGGITNSLSYKGFNLGFLVDASVAVMCTRWICTTDRVPASPTTRLS